MIAGMSGERDIEAIDRTRDYSRVLAERPGYAYRPGEPEILAAGAGLATAPRPHFEFDPLETIGQWLFLGGRVRRLRVAPDAIVERNTPMSQGGCHRWSADRIELLEILDLAALMPEFDRAGVTPEFLHIAHYELPPRFQFPTRARSILLTHCLACDPLELPRELERLEIWSCALHVGSWPVKLTSFTAGSSMFTGAAGPPAGAGRIDVNDCSFS